MDEVFTIITLISGSLILIAALIKRRLSATLAAASTPSETKPSLKEFLLHGFLLVVAIRIMVESLLIAYFIGAYGGLLSPIGIGTLLVGLAALGYVVVTSYSIFRT